MAGTFSRLLYHVVFSTKQRTPFIDPRLRPELYPYMEGIVRRQGGWLLALGGMPDHVHVLLRLKPDMPVLDLVRHVKGGSSKWVHEQQGLSPEFSWQLGYAVFSVSESKESAVRAGLARIEWTVWLSGSELLLEVRGSLVVQGRVSSLPIVEDLDVVEDIGSSLGSGLPGLGDRELNRSSLPL